MKTRGQRKKEITKIVTQAMSDLAAKREVNWMREGAEVEQAVDVLDKEISNFIDGKGSRDKVKTAYKKWINTLEGDTNG